MSGTRSVPDSRWRLFALCCGLFILGCSESESRRYPIRGEVSLDAEPIHNASIVLTPKGQGLASVASIEQGKFAFTSTNGPSQGDFYVRINPKGMEMDERQTSGAPHGTKPKQRIPMRYQKIGELSLQVEDRDEQFVRLRLSSKP